MIKASSFWRIQAMALTLSLATAGQAFAQTAPSPDDSKAGAALPPADIQSHMGELEQMAELQRQIDILKLQVQVTQLKSTISKSGDPSDTTNAGDGGSGAGPAQAQANAAPSSPDNAKAVAAAQKLLPVVASIGGVEGRLSADILVPFRGEYPNVHEGDMLPNDLRVVSITSRGVTVDQNGADILLSEGNSVPAQLDLPQSQAPAGLTPIAPGVPAPSVP